MRFLDLLEGGSLPRRAREWVETGLVDCSQTESPGTSLEMPR